MSVAPRLLLLLWLVVSEYRESRVCLVLVSLEPGGDRQAVDLAVDAAAPTLTYPDLHHAVILGTLTTR